MVHHAKEMYYYIRSTLTFNKRVQIPKKVLMSANFEEIMEGLMKNTSIETIGSQK